MIALTQVTQILEPWLGPGLTGETLPAAEEIRRLLNAYTIRRDIESLYREIDSRLFLAVHRGTRGSMLVTLADGGRVRMRLEDVAVLSDELLFLALSELPVDQKHLQAVQQYALHRDSLAALKALYTHFSSLQTQEELKAIAGLVRSCYPPFRWRMWLDEA